jgi:hypothetical protein
LRGLFFGNNFPKNINTTRKNTLARTNYSYEKRQKELAKKKKKEEKKQRKLEKMKISTEEKETTSPSDDEQL